MNEQMDTFNDMTPIEEAPEMATSGGEDLDTFSDLTPVQEEASGTEEPSQEAETEKQPEAESEAGQADQLEEEEVSDKKTKEEDGEDAPSAKEESETEDSTTEEKEPAKKPEGPTFRLKSGEDAVDVSQEATVKVKVNGKNEFVALKDLTANYSGSVAYEEKFATLQEESSTFKRERDTFVAEKNEIVEDLKGVFGKLNDPEANPMDALTYLLDITGKPVHTYMKRVMEHQLDELEQLQNMSETEMNLYWTNKENEYLRSNQEAHARRTESLNIQQDRNSRISNLRETHGVSEEEFSEVREELTERNGGKDVAPEEVVQYAKFKPLFTVADGYIQENFSDQLGDTDLENLAAETARLMFTVGQIGEGEAARLAATNLGFKITSEEDKVKQLEDKVEPHFKKPKNVKKVAANEEEGHIESFEDFF